MAAVLLAAVSSRAEGTLLNIGSPAPAIKVEKWVKGTPVTAFETGKVYVVEFWATWCGPCKVAMPHLSELARKFTNKVTFTGVSVLEQGEDTTKKVEAFVKDMGDKMGYNVCADGSAAFMAANWLAAAGESGIPCTFVIDGGGKVAWIGHPNALEEVLEKVLAGTADYRELAKTARRRGPERRSNPRRRGKSRWPLIRKTTLKPSRPLTAPPTRWSSGNSRPKSSGR
jgi:thiol-disulfide isomerase/thioredoxin